MFLYAYGDIFDLYRASTLKRLLNEQSPLGPMNDGVLLAFAALMAVPSLVLALTLLLPAAITRWLNVVIGIVYTAVALLAIVGEQPFYVFLGLLEAGLTLAVTWTALRWRRQAP